MIDRKNVHEALENFKNKVIEDSKRNFQSKSVSGKGLKSLGGELNTYPRSFDLDFYMEDYMEYQDKGVSGIKKKFNTPFRYKDKRPPASAFDKWSIRKGLAPRDEEGKFKQRKSLNYAIANSVFNYGIKPSLFFTKAFEKHFKDLPDEIVEAFGLDVEDLMRFTLDAK